jgi:OFA family oxalate/formate antiporter-like MFS transporter
MLVTPTQAACATIAPHSNAVGVTDTRREMRPGPALPTALAARLPFYYGWIVLAALCCAGFARQGSAVATFSVFVEPLTRDFGWSRTALSGAVSLGGVLAALVAPMIGPVLDRRGSRLVLSLAVLVSGGALLLLSLAPSLLVFYLLFCIARMNWAAPFELGIYAGLNNWFLARRTAAAAIANLAQMLGLAAMPLIAQFAIARDGWRAGWIALGAAVLIAGFLPVALLLVRRPEDMGLKPDRARAAAAGAAARPEPAFSRPQALRSAAFWLLMLYAMLIYPVQAGVSLHQASHLVRRGLDPTTAALIVSFFSLASAAATIVCGFLPRRLPIRLPLACAGLLAAIGTWLMPGINSAADGYFCAGLFGAGIGSMLTLLPIAWADYFGRAHYGAIRGVALPCQVLAQAAGPLVSGALYDWTGAYTLSLHVFATLSALSIVVALAAKEPRRT